LSSLNDEPICIESSYNDAQNKLRTEYLLNEYATNVLAASYDPVIARNLLELVKELKKAVAKIIANIHYEGEIVSLTDLWKAAGSPKNKGPKFWLRIDSTIQLIATVGSILKVSENHLLKIKRGKGGGTIAHKQLIALKILTTMETA